MRYNIQVNRKDFEINGRIYIIAYALDEDC